ncbi:MAG: hypothetical protein N4A74_06710 [Carboxylicivirga sp.]|jgi:septal ring factor EnvC (AmiA/AmiB activator)|nr:hypothetical protein [Carboxylicivirga sp.]
MNDRLKDYIDQNKDAFDALDAPTGAWDAIENKLHGSKNKRRNFFRYSAIASAAALIGVFVYVAILQSQPDEAVMAENDQLSETELFYSAKISQKRAKVYQMSTQYPELQSEMDLDLAELDTAMLELKRDLKDNVDNAEVVEAMIQNYRMKLSILEDIMQFLEEQQENNDKKHKSYAL